MFHIMYIPGYDTQMCHYYVAAKKVAIVRINQNTVAVVPTVCAIVCSMCQHKQNVWPDLMRAAGSNLPSDINCVFSCECPKLNAMYFFLHFLCDKDEWINKVIYYLPS